MPPQKTTHQTRDPHEWRISIEEKLNDVPPPSSWAKLCVYKAPKRFTDADCKPFYPHVVSIGPYHHRSRPAMDQHKWRAFRQVIDRTGKDKNLYLDSMERLVVATRECYDRPIDLSDQELVETMVLDGCFVLELLHGEAAGFNKLGYKENDPVFALRRRITHSLRRDLLIIDNQLPFLVLDHLLGLQIGKPAQKGLVAKLARLFFLPLINLGDTALCITKKVIDFSVHNRHDDKFLENLVDSSTEDHGGLHFLDLFRKILLETKPLSPNTKAHQQSASDDQKSLESLTSAQELLLQPQEKEARLVHCVAELKEVGIEFKKGEANHFLHIEFEDNNNVLKIPRIYIHDISKTLFLNLVAFEQCHLDCGNDITAYLSFMDNLVNSEGDVAHLHECEIIEHGLGSDKEVADLFNGLCREVVFDVNDGYLSGVAGSLSKKIRSYHDSRLDRWRLSLKHYYFSSPRSVCSLAAAISLLQLTVLGTFYTVYAYYRPPRP